MTVLKKIPTDDIGVVLQGKAILRVNVVQDNSQQVKYIDLALQDAQNVITHIRVETNPTYKDELNFYYVEDYIDREAWVIALAPPSAVCCHYVYSSEVDADKAYYTLCSQYNVSTTDDMQVEERKPGKAIIFKEKVIKRTYSNNTVAFFAKDGKTPITLHPVADTDARNLIKENA